MKRTAATAPNSNRATPHRRVTWHRRQRSAPFMAEGPPSPRAERALSRHYEVQYTITGYYTYKPHYYYDKKKKRIILVYVIHIYIYTLGILLCERRIVPYTARSPHVR